SAPKTMREVLSMVSSLLPQQRQMPNFIGRRKRDAEVAALSIEVRATSVSGQRCFCPLLVGRFAVTAVPANGFEAAGVTARRTGRAAAFFPGPVRGKIKTDEVPMNVQPNLRMDKAAFIAWMAANEGRYELAGGRVVMIPGVSRSHGLMVSNLVVVLRAR